MKKYIYHTYAAVIILLLILNLNVSSSSADGVKRTIIQQRLYSEEIGSTQHKLSSEAVMRCVKDNLKCSR